METQQRIALVTGAAGGVGQSTADAGALRLAITSASGVIFVLNIFLLFPCINPKMGHQFRE